ncbi:MAG: ABC transporter permease [Lachnospiraceae bacterium]|nr:ABC transporter permease [Lachnospiraceae bacterium]
MTMFIENIRLAFASLKANRSRAFLTMLGIIIGIASVIAIMTVGNSLTMSVSSSMQSMGANNITVSVKQRDAKTEERENGVVFGETNKRRNMTEEDYITDEMLSSMRQTFSDSIEAIAASESVGSATVKNEKNSETVNITGVSQGYFTANELTLLAGSLFSENESANARNVILLADTLVDDVYGGSYMDVLGKTVDVRVNGQMVEFNIIGVYQYEESLFGASETTTVYIPFTSAQKLNHSKNYASFSVVSKVGTDSEMLATEIEDYLNGYYRSNQYYEVNAYSMASMVSTMSDMLGTVTLAIAVIAGIALLVGGIGVMNIMMVSITERTREIGTRKALGASNGYIRMQFILEAMVICMLGGVIGIFVGIGLGALGASLLGYSASPSVGSIVFSLAFSLMIGLFFGYYPANKAAKMNPIDALRYE